MSFTALESVACHLENKVAAMRKNQDLVMSISCADVAQVPVAKGVTVVLSTG